MFSLEEFWLEFFKMDELERRDKIKPIVKNIVGVIEGLKGKKELIDHSVTSLLLEYFNDLELAARQVEKKELEK